MRGCALPLAAVSTRGRFLLVIVPVVLAVAVGGVLLAVTGGDDSAPAATGSDTLNPHPVAGNFEPDETTLDECEDGRCWEQAFGNLAYEEGPKVALARFDKAMASDPAVEGNCHRIVHTIGSAALSRYDGNVARAFSEGSSSCWSGYYHGILERALIGARTKGELATAVNGLCDDDGVRANTFIAYQCVHGIGHGLMIRSGLNLPLSLSICEELATEWDQTSCDGGVFMENFNTSYGVKSPYLKDDDPVYPCNTVAERHKLYCYLQITDRLLAVSNYDWNETSAQCATVETNWRATCFQSYGRSASGVARLDRDQLIAFCNIPKGQWRSECVYGAIRDIVSNDAGAKRGAGFCMAIDESLRTRCFNGAGTILADISGSPEKHQAACEAITKQYLDACLLRVS
jgi:hypothetical protein